MLTGARYMGSAAGFLSQILLARLLPPEGLGIFFTLTSLAAVLGLVATQGYPGLFQRFVTRYGAKNQPRVFKAFLVNAERQAAIALSVLAAAAVAWIMITKTGRAEVVPAFAVALCVVASAMFSIYPALASVSKRFAVAVLPENLARPLLFMSLLTAALMATMKLTVNVALLLYAGTSVALALAQFFAVRVNHQIAAAPVGVRQQRMWRNEAWPLLTTSIFTLMFADMVILATSVFLPAEEMGPFGMALKIAMLAGFALQVGQQTALPDISESLHRTDHHGLKSALLRACLFPAVATFSALVIFSMFGSFFLGAIGPGYQAAAASLSILTAVQVMRAVAGPAPLMLTLAGSQIANATISMTSCATVFAAGALLIPPFGMAGAAISVFLAIAVWAGGSCLALWRLHRLRSDLLFSISAERPAEF